jgi:hypothetical protein
MSANGTYACSYSSLPNFASGSRSYVNPSNALTPIASNTFSNGATIFTFTSVTPGIYNFNFTGDLYYANSAGVPVWWNTVLSSSSSTTFCNIVSDGISLGPGSTYYPYGGAVNISLLLPISNNTDISLTISGQVYGNYAMTDFTLYNYTYSLCRIV